MTTADSHTAPALRKLLLRGGSFVLLLILLDISIGWGLKHWYFQQQSGKYHRISYALQETEAEILFVGTSHAVRHFIPEIFTDSLGLSGYNLGARGQHLYYCDAMLDAILARYTPKAIVINIDRDLFYAEGNYDKLSDLKPYYWDIPILQAHLQQRGPFEQYLLCSGLYTYNSTIIHLLRYTAKPQPDFAGYLPLDKRLPEAYQAEKADQSGNDFVASKAQISLLEQRIQQAQQAGSKVYLVISPIVSGDWIRNRQLEDMAKRLNVPFWNYSQDQDLIRKNLYFGDEIHLNHAGAQIFSRKVAQQIKQHTSALHHE